MTFASFGLDEETPQVLKDAARSLNSNRKKGSNYFKAAGLEINNYLKDSKHWSDNELDVFELGLYVALEMTKQSALDALKGMLKFP
jgi:hypothetical protein